MYDRPARYVSHHDGDTITLLIDQGFYDRKQIDVRLANVWAPELNEPGGNEVRGYLGFVIHSVPVEEWPFVVHFHKTKTGKDIKSFDRYVATVMIKDGNNSLNSLIMQYISDKGFTGGIGKAGLLRGGS